MADTREAKVPDIGDFQGVPVIEVMIKPGDHVDKDQGLVTLESAKATMEVPSPFAGTVREVNVKVNDEVAHGDVIASIEADDADSGDGKPEKSDDANDKPGQSDDKGKNSGQPEDDDQSAQPVDDGDKSAQSDDDGEKSGQSGDKEQSSPSGSGHDDEDAEPAQTSDGTSNDDSEDHKSGSSPAAAQHHGAPGHRRQLHSEKEGKSRRRSPPVSFDAESVMPGKVPYASPVVRAFARELGVDLTQVTGSERGGRISKDDVQKFVKAAMSGGAKPATAAGGGGLNLLPWPQVDFSKFGDVETEALSRIKKLSGANLARNWAMIPHVTQFEDADITGLEALRKNLNKEHEKEGIKVTLLAFLIKASVTALQKYPNFNASLDASGENLVLKKYFHIGFAADTPNGLMVPVIRDCDQKGVLEIAQEMSSLAKKARDGKLGPAEMSGGCFSISSLGGIGGTAFTPIINAPEVAILGVSRSSMQPVWNGTEFAPRLILPLSLSYDHRVIDGAAAARFAAFLAQLLADLRRALL